MTQVDFEQPSQDAPASRPSGSGRIVAAGVVGALALGAGLGLWARPASPPESGARAAAPEAAPRPALQIVVDDGPAPIGPLLEVLPGEPSRAAEPSPAPAELQAPRGAAGLMKVDAVVAAGPLLAPAVKIEPKPEISAPTPPEAPIRKAAPMPKLSAPKADKRVAVGSRETALARVETTKAEKTRVEKAKLEKSKLEKARTERARAEKAEGDARLAKAERAKAEKAGKLAKADKAKAAKAKATKLAKADARKPAPEGRRLTTLVKAVKTAPARLKAEVAKKKVEVAQARTAPKAQKASVRPPAAKAVAAKPPARRPAPVGEGPMRVARNDACAAGDAGEAAVCADRRLGVRDRQLQQAYRNAEAAGVPASALRRQQARWLQARAAAAREAPWAVEDVYEARIAELNDLTRDAREN